MIKKAAAARSPEELVALLSAVSSAILAVIIVATLYFGREIFVPVALAILLSFVLAPVVNFLQRIRIPRAVAVVSVVALAFAAIFGLGGLMATQLTQLAGDLPRYQSTMREKIQSFRGATAGSGTLERAADMLQDLSKELDKPKDTTRASAGPLVRQASPTGAVQPVPVEVRQPDPGALESLRTVISPLIHPLATTGIIVIFVIFILLQREDLRNRFIRLAGAHDLQRTTAALDDAGSRLSRLFLDSARRERRVWPRDRARPLADRRTERGAVGHPRWGTSFCAVHWRLHRGSLSVGARGGGRPGLVDAVMDARTLPGYRACCRPRGRAHGLWPQHGAFACSGRGIGNLLDGFVGPDRSRPRDTSDGVPSRSRASRGAPRVP